MQELGIHKIYVSQFRNLTFRPGIEQLFTTAMVREIGRSRSFELVNNEKDADAVLSGVVSSMESSPSSTQTFKLPRTGQEPRSVQIASEYSASVTCSIELQDHHGHQLFSQIVSGSKVHPGTASMGDAGATAPLVIDSEQRLAVQFLASQMMASVYQRMIDTF